MKAAARQGLQLQPAEWSDSRLSRPLPPMPGLVPAGPNAWAWTHEAQCAGGIKETKICPWREGRRRGDNVGRGWSGGLRKTKGRDKRSRDIETFLNLNQIRTRQRLGGRRENQTQKRSTRDPRLRKRSRLSDSKGTRLRRWSLGPVHQREGTWGE